LRRGGSSRIFSSLPAAQARGADQLPIPPAGRPAGNADRAVCAPRSEDGVAVVAKLMEEMMFRRSGSLLLMVALLGTAPLPLAAQGAPDLVGTWRGRAYGAHIGPNPYRVPEREGVNFPENALEFTYTITRQEGNRFAGEVSGGTAHRETLIGALQPDNRGGIMLDDDGQHTFTLRDPNTMDLCYHHSYPSSKIVACYAITRSR
jgi:hypothetical protein